MAGTERIEEILKTAPDKGCVHAFVMIDLDNFKSLNDVFGHMWGDKALFEVAGIMKNHCRSQDVVCRLGGDEFIVFLKNIPKDVVEKNVSSLTKKLRIPYEKDEQIIVISGSVGIALMPENGATFKELYEAADGALYKVKNEFKGEYYFSRKKL